MFISLVHRKFLKQQLYSFKMVESKTTTEQLTKFNKILDDLENIEVNLEDADKDILLLCALPRSFESFKDTMLYGQEGTVTLEEVQAALRTKELTKFKDLRADENSEGLSVSRGNGGGRGNWGSSKSGKSQSISALSVTSLVTSRGIVRRTMITLRKLSLRSKRTWVLWWCVVGRMKKVMVLTLVMMPCRAVVVQRDIKHSTSAWRGGRKNTQGQPGEAV